MDPNTNFYEGKALLVTGGAGSIGSHLVKRLLDLNPKVVRVLDNNETGLFDLEKELGSPKIRPFIGDVRDEDRLKRAFEGVDIVFHAAALKHVPLCEYNPFDAVKTNVLGTQNVLNAALDKEVEKVILISTDKAVNPTNVMGATKLLAERLTISANYYKGDRRTALSCVRFGNVLNSRGSVIPLFKRQIKLGEAITLTDPEMTRFIMSIPNAVELILKAAEIAAGGEIFILKMPIIKISDLAEAMIEELAPNYGHTCREVKIIGPRPGEKLYEELMTGEESGYAYEDDKMIVILPQDTELSHRLPYDFPHDFRKTTRTEYSSQNAKILDKEDVKSLIRDMELRDQQENL